MLNFQSTMKQASAFNLRKALSVTDYPLHWYISLDHYKVHFCLNGKRGKLTGYFNWFLCMLSSHEKRQILICELLKMIAY